MCARLAVDPTVCNLWNQNEPELGLYWTVDFIIRPNKNIWNYYSAEYK